MKAECLVMRISVKDLLFEGAVIYPLYRIPVVQALRKYKHRHSTDRVRKLADEKDNIGKIVDNFEKHTSGVLPDDSFFDGKVVLEVGPGLSCGMALYFLARGAKKVVMVDREPRFFLDVRDEQVIREICDFLEESYSTAGLYSKAMLNEKTPLEFNPEALEIHRTGINNVPLPDDSVDFIFSNAVLEHVSEPALALREMYRLLKPGSLMAHQVDLRVHGPVKKKNPLAHLHYAPWEWRILTARKMSYTNRLRLSQFVSLIKESGFDLKHLKMREGASEELPENQRNSFYDDFREMSDQDLRTLGFFFVAKKRS